MSNIYRYQQLTQWYIFMKWISFVLKYNLIDDNKKLNF